MLPPSPPLFALPLACRSLPQPTPFPLFLVLVSSIRMAGHDVASLYAARLRDQVMIVFYCPLHLLSGSVQTTG